MGGGAAAVIDVHSNHGGMTDTEILDMRFDDFGRPPFSDTYLMGDIMVNITSSIKADELGLSVRYKPDGTVLVTRVRPNSYM